LASSLSFKEKQAHFSKRKDLAVSIKVKNVIILEDEMDMGEFC